MITCITKSVEVDVHIAIDDLVVDLSDNEKIALLHKLTGTVDVPLGAGDGDQQRIDSIIERAFLAAQNLPAVPHEIVELFWHVHGRALA